MWLSRASQFGQKLGGMQTSGSFPCTGPEDCAAFFASPGCGIVPAWKAWSVRGWATEEDPCDGSWLGDLLQLRPLGSVCPLTCGCASATLTHAEATARGCLLKCVTAPWAASSR